MLRRLCVFVLVLQFSPPLWCAEPAAPNYMPLSVGNDWYQAITANEKTERRSIRVDSFVEVEGKQVARIVEAMLDGRQFTVDWMAQDAGGLYRYMKDEKGKLNGMQILKYPPEAGDKTTGKLHNDKGETLDIACIVTGEEEVELYDKKIKSVKIIIITQRAGKPAETVMEWYADNYGLIQRKWTEEGVEKVMLSQSPGTDLRNLLPLAVGNYWTYEVTTDQQTYTGTQRVAKMETIEGREVAYIVSGDDLTAAPSLCYSQNDEGVDIYNADPRGGPVYPLFQYPISSFQDWKHTGQHSYKGKIEAEEVEVEVPAGKFKAVKSEVILKTVDRKNRTTTTKVYTWAVDGVGIVQTETYGGGVSFVSKLAKYKVGDAPEQPAAKP